MKLSVRDLDASEFFPRSRYEHIGYWHACNAPCRWLRSEGNACSGNQCQVGPKRKAPPSPERWRRLIRYRKPTCIMEYASVMHDHLRSVRHQQGTNNQKEKNLHQSLFESAKISPGTTVQNQLCCMSNRSTAQTLHSPLPSAIPPTSPRRTSRYRTRRGS